MSNLSEEIKRLAKPLFDEGAVEVYAAECCDRVFVGRFPPTTCRTCGLPVKYQTILHSALDKG